MKIIYKKQRFLDASEQMRSDWSVGFRKANHGCFANGFDITHTKCTCSLFEIPVFFELFAWNKNEAAAYLFKFIKSKVSENNN